GVRRDGLVLLNTGRYRLAQRGKVVETQGGSVVKGFFGSRPPGRWFLKPPGPAPLALASPPAVGEMAETAPPQSEHVRLTVNGRSYALDLDPRTTLLDALREHFGLTGSKKGCDQGQCGACTIILNGQRINRCLALPAI